MLNGWFHSHNSGCCWDNEFLDHRLIFDKFAFSVVIIYKHPVHGQCSVPKNIDSPSAMLFIHSSCSTFGALMKSIDIFVIDRISTTQKKLIILLHKKQSAPRIKFHKKHSEKLPYNKIWSVTASHLVLFSLGRSQCLPRIPIKLSRTKNPHWNKVLPGQANWER